MNQKLKWFSVLTSVGMLLVLLAGALVTKTESGRGCGDDWPLCNGKFIPAYTVESMIEYSHRAVTGIVGIMVIILTIWVYRSMKQHKEAKLYAMGILYFTVIQAILGAMAVKWEQSDAVMALHFGISLIAFAFTLLLVLYLYRLQSPNNQQGTAIAAGFRNFLTFILFYSYVLVYLGAYVRHTESSGGCSGWPLCNGEIIPELTGAAGVVFIHRLAAAVFFLLVVIMYILARKFDLEIRYWALTALLFTVAQVLSGAFVTTAVGYENMYLLAGLMHSLIICGLFSVLSYLTIRVWQRSAKSLAKRTGI